MMDIENVISQIEMMKEQTDCEDYQDELDEDISIDIEAIKNHQSTSRLYQYMGLFPTSTTLRSYFDDVLIRKDGRFVIPELECLNPENLM